MTSVYDWNQIREVIDGIDLIAAMEEAFVAYSEGRAVVPPVGELVFRNPPGDAHIKYGYIVGDDYFVIKVASGFYGNIKRGLPSCSGLMLIFRQETGLLASVLLDEGNLTNLRTAAAGAVAAKYLGPKKVRCIGVFGTGTQARLQVEHVRPIVNCTEVIACGRNEEGLEQYRADMEASGFHVETTLEPKTLASRANLIVTATPSGKPLLSVEELRPGTHITAMGSDTADKIELDPRILAKADLVVADSIEQCLSRGEVHHAMEAGLIGKERVVELGKVIRDPKLRRCSEEQVTVADLTGVAVQDIEIAKAVYGALTVSAAS